MEKRIAIDAIAPGMILARPIINENGKIMLAEGTALSETQLKRLRAQGIIYLNVRPLTAVAEQEAPRSEEEFRFLELYDETFNKLKTAFSHMQYFREVPLAEMSELAASSIDPLLETFGVINYLQTVRHYDDYTFRHSLNVAIISGILGKWLTYAGEPLKEIILTGLLHDIGKVEISADILHKPDKLTEAEAATVKNHSLAGYRLLASAPRVAQGVLLGVLQHHERLDGSGYPFRSCGDKIHRYAKIVAVADVYDAMTSERAYDVRHTPFAVAATLNQEMYDKLDPVICLTFLNNIRDYFIGSRVVLDNGEVAEVVSMGPIPAARPVVKTARGEFIDLEIEKHIAIVEYLPA